MTLVRWKPLRDISRWSPVTDLTGEFLNMQKDIDRMFDRFRLNATDDNGMYSLTPSVDIIENDDDFTVTVELPGVDKKDVKITVADGVLTLRGEKKGSSEVKSDRFQRLERTFGSFERSFTLPTTVKSEQIGASFSNGILTITIPKAEQAKAKEIEVNVK
jgi:HSP20 family protein